MSTRLLLATAFFVVVIASAHAGGILTQGALNAELGTTCASRSLAAPCITPATMSDLIVSAAPGAVTTGIAAAGSTQGTATALTTQISDVTTVAAGTGVVLPAAVAGQQSVVCNDGVNALQVYPFSGATIGALAANAPIMVPPGQCAGLTAFSTSAWRNWTGANGAGASAAALIDAATVAVPGATGVYALTLTANGHTIANPTNAIVGQLLDFLIVQPPTGGPYTVSWGTGYGWANGSAPTLNQLPSATTEVWCRVTNAAPTLLCYGPTNSAFGQAVIASSPTPPTCIALASQTASFTNGSANIVLATAAINVGCPLQLTTTGTLPTNFAVSTTYYVVSLASLTITVSATPGGTAISAGSAGSGVQSAVAQQGFLMQGLASGFSIITPATTGNVLCTISGTIVDVSGAVAGDGVIYQIAFGLGRGPANAANLLNTTEVGYTQEATAQVSFATTPLFEPFSIQAILAQQVPGQPLYCDLAAGSVGHVGKVGFTNLTITAMELR